MIPFWLRRGVTLMALHEHVFRASEWQEIGMGLLRMDRHLFPRHRMVRLLESAVRTTLNGLLTANSSA